MGNSVPGCVGRTTESICAGRRFPAFIAPNTDHVTYSFDYADKTEIKLWNDGNEDSRPISDEGFNVEPQKTSERRAPKLHTVKEYMSSPAQLRLHLSGRVFVDVPQKPVAMSARGLPNAGTCAFKICTRGCPIYESVVTKTFTHTAQVITSGVFFTLSVSAAPDGLYLCPRIVLVLESGDEVELVSDKLGPLQAPQAFFMDFAILDDGGRNVQMDLIFRGYSSPMPGPGEPVRGMRTLRTCLQDYTAFNNDIHPARISFGYSDLRARSCVENNIASAGHLHDILIVHLQNLVISEEPFDEPVPEPEPYDVWNEDCANKILFVGERARASSVAVEAQGQALKKNQHNPAHMALSPRSQSQGYENGHGDGIGAENFWYHIKYSDHTDGRKQADPLASEYATHIKGEFWLSKQAVDKKNVYFHCSSTLAEALTMCIAFRFSCPTEYLSLIERAVKEREAAYLLRDVHIPTNGVVLGIEQDPRHRGLFRMFIEHRNEILDDMVVCECRATELMHSIVHQEVYDGGEVIVYRITLAHRDGTRQSAVLQMDGRQLEDPDLTERGGSNYAAEEPSPRFPIAPCLGRGILSPANRIFVYSGISRENDEDNFADARQANRTDRAHDDGQSDGDGSPWPRFSNISANQSDATAEDWQSVGGGVSDCEPELAQETSTSWIRGGSGRSSPPLQGTGHVKTAAWRPLVESVVLLSRMEEQPFKCFPMSLS